ncbi:unnamed protein product [Arabis nemorensis]|uniref:Alpha-carbonic anhydrase domain-containing protein n=1 Tax=Arabis nemorensis TaxID=586526 RepID=A0A565CHK4_9BRAS|nr:unnamed protein product [Arabis nemorensis]
MSIKPEWKICGTGKRQSPIDLTPKIARIVHNSTELLQTYYKPVEATLKNRGYDMMVSWEDDAGKIVINDTNYKLVQTHWHAPSEHFLNGQKMAMELHMVHKSEGHLAVIGVLFREGAPNAFISRIMDKINSIADVQGGEASIGTIDPREEFEWDLTKFYEYRGSLTTPPCTEDVMWTISNKVGTVSREQISAVVDARRGGYEANARPAQALYGRTVYLNEQTIASEH